MDATKAAPLPRPALLAWAFVFFGGNAEGHQLLYVAYLDEFGHVGPYISRTDPAHKTSPVFGLGGIVLPHDRIRDFATWFYKLKCHLLQPEITRDGVHPARWEKKGSALLTTRNFEKYPELGKAMNRILNKIQEVGGFVFYVGLAKHKAPEDSSSEQLYAVCLKHAIQRLNKQCVNDGAEFMLVLDESDSKFHRDVIVKKASLTMFGQDFCSRLVEPPFQVCSHLHQTLQCADWICGLLGRIGAFDAEPLAFSDFEWARKYFGERLERASKRSSIRSKERGIQLREKYAGKETVTILGAASVTGLRVVRSSQN